MGQAIIDAIDEGVRTLNDAKRQAPPVFRRIADDLNTWGVPWPDFAKDAAYEAAIWAFNQQTDIAIEILLTCRDLVARMGLPTVLRNEASAIKAGILATQASLENAVTLQNLEGLSQSTWISDAAAHYSTAFSDHEDQIDDLKQTVEGLIRVLEDAADSQDSWYSSNLFNTVGATVSIAGLVVAIATGVSGWGAIIGLIIAIVGVLVSLIGYFLEAGNSQGRADTLSGVLSGSTLPEWPRPSFSS